MCFYSLQREVCQACYSVIKSYLQGNSRKNENYLARFIKFFQKQVCCVYGCDVIMRIVLVCTLGGYVRMYVTTYVMKKTLKNSQIRTG